MWGPLLWIVKLFSGLDINGLVGKAVDVYSKSKDTQVTLDDHEKDLIEKQTQLAVREEALNADIIKSEQGNWLTRSIRPLFALPFVIYIWKLVVWDKVLGLGVTDGLNNWLYGIAGTIIGSYFVGSEIRRTIVTYRHSNTAQ